MEFKTWLESEESIEFARFSNDGIVDVYIRGKLYRYLTDAVYHEKWKRMVKWSPGKVLNEIKKMVNAGTAKQLVPEVVPVTPIDAAPNYQPRYLF